jgi:hypothetical protein
MVKNMKELIWFKAMFHLMTEKLFLLNIYWNWYIFNLLFLLLVMTSARAMASTITCYNYYVFLMLLAVSTFDNNGPLTTTGMTSCLIKELFLKVHIQEFS